jgi:hypothetical protein
MQILQMEQNINTTKFSITKLKTLPTPLLTHSLHSKTFNITEYSFICIKILILRLSFFL